MALDGAGVFLKRKFNIANLSTHTKRTAAAVQSYKVSPTFCGVVDPPTLFVVIFAPTFFVVRYNTLCGQCYNTFCGFAITNFVVLPSSVYLNDK